MGVINILDKHTAELIAAGEVVERPASVIKELVENCIDAGAKNVTVEIKHGGTTFMRVSDDGCGILREDIKIAFLRHTTSKVKTENDLDAINTLGFRGEALASICAVSRLQLITRNKAENLGTSYEIDGGEEISLDDAGCAVGTTFVVRDLFYNIPARAKFLKKDVSEGNAVSSVIDKIALSHPEVSFTYIKDGKHMLKTYGDAKLISAIYSVFGRDFANGLLPVNYELNGIKITGYLSKPEYSRSNRSMQNFFINGRYVKTRTAMAAIEEACKGSIMVGKFPACVLRMELSCEAVDVNVHPSKLEVRFINERPVFDAFYHAVKSTLLEYDGRKKVKFKEETAYNDIAKDRKFNPFNNATAILKKSDNDNFAVQKENKTENKIFTKEKNIFDELDLKETDLEKANLNSIKLSDSADPFDMYSKKVISNAKNKENQIEKIKENYIEEKKTSSKFQNEIKNNQSFSSIKNESEIIAKTDNSNNIEQEKPSISNLLDDEPKTLISDMDKPRIKYIGEAFDTYIFAQKSDNEILIIDKHAAHERMIYEKLKKDYHAYSQILLSPLTLTLSKDLYDAAINNLEMFTKCAFDIEDFGEGTLLVRSCPQYLDASEIKSCVEEMCGYLVSGKRDIFTEKMDWFYHNIACRSAIKAGNTSTPQELIDIVQKLEDNPQIKYCPHGRPICIVMTKYEIEKQFGRV